MAYLPRPAWLVVWFAAGSFAACAWPDAPPGPAPSHMAAEETQTHRVGRLLVDLPTSARVADGSNGGTYDWTPIQEQPWPARLAAEGRERDEARAADWAERLADAERRVGEARELARMRGRSPDAIRVSDRPLALANGRWGRVLSWPDETGSMTTIVAVADAGPVRLVSQDQVITSRVAYAVDGTADVLAAYVPAGTPGYGTEDWFYLRYGAVARPPAEFETTATRFVGHPAFEEITLGVSTQLTAPEGPSLLGRWREERGGGLRRLLDALPPRPASVDLQEVRAGNRTAGPFAGEEVVAALRMREADEPEPRESLRLQWEHTGTPNAPRDPDVKVKATLPPVLERSQADVDRALAAWDAALESIRFAP